MRVEPRVELVKIVQRANEEPGAGEEDQGQCHLRADQRRQQARSGTAHPAVAQRGQRSSLHCRLDRGRQPEQDAGCDRDRAGKAEHLPVRRQVEGDFDRPGGEHRDEKPARRPRQADADDRADRESRMLSIRSCRTIRARPAPIARRTAISRCRDAARASSRLATLAQAISSTSPTAAISTKSGARYSLSQERPAGSAGTSTRRQTPPAPCVARRTSAARAPDRPCEATQYSGMPSPAPSTRLRGAAPARATRSCRDRGVAPRSATREAARQPPS